MSISPSLRERARLWIAGDPDEQTRNDLDVLLGAEDDAGLELCFEPALRFGTAGLRGAVGAGPARMNRAVVRRVAWGLARFLLERGLAERGVVVGYDARPSSRRFAEDTCAVLSGQGVPVRVFEEPVPTPFVAFACRALGAGAGVVVTASHNPRGDNGYKVYDDGGVQIVAPWDDRIAALMAEAPPANEMLDSEALVRAVPHDVVDEYFAGLARLGGAAAKPSAERLRVAYTPLHGVGLAPVRRALGGAVELCVVESQADPDGSFPTTPFPNPEEPGTLDRLLELARTKSCALALANDPDADRLAVCVPSAKDSARFRMLSGDEMGALLADHLLASRAPGSRTPVVAASVVSSPLIEAIAEAYGARVARTLTGFKWLCRVAEHLAPDEELAFAYEEALGLCVDPARVRDKDGISAAVVTVEFARELAARNQTLGERLEQLAARHGLWVSAPRSVRLTGAGASERMAQTLERLRADAPTVVAGLAVTDVVDFARGAETRPPYLGAQDLLSLTLTGTEVHPGVVGRVLVRPSGTEPKLKLYVHLGARVHGASDLPATEQALQALAERVGDELIAAAALA